MNSNSIRLKEHHVLQNIEFDEFELADSKGSKLTVLNYGATLQSLRIRLATGELREVLMGCEIADSLSQDAYFGATIGRFANRIKCGHFIIGDQNFRLSRNQHGHCLHGGALGFDKRIWKADIIESNGQPSLRMTLNSVDGDQGFPGNIEVQALFRWRNDGELEIKLLAEVDKPCPVSLTSHGYYNLTGFACDVRQHQISIAADQFLPVDKTGIPEQGLQSVVGTVFDFNSRKTIISQLEKNQSLFLEGFDHSFLLKEHITDMTQAAATLTAPDQSLTMALFTNQPALQFYTARFLEGRPARNGSIYQKFEALCLEPQMLPDSPNHADFSDCILRPGERYENCIRLKFSADQRIAQ